MEQSPHSQVAAAIYNCKGGDEFVQERKGLSFGVRKVCSPYYGDGEDGEEYAGLDLTSLDERSLGLAKGVVVKEVIDGVDIDSRDARSLSYPLPDMSGKDIGKYLEYSELELIAADSDDVDYESLSEEEKARYSEFGDAWIKKLESEGPTALMPVPVPLPGPVPVALAPQPDKVI